MGYFRHNAIVVIGVNQREAEKAHALALEHFKGIAPVTELHVTPVNDFWTFAVLPDGSKEGWSRSDSGDAARYAFREAIQDCGHVEVQFGSLDPGEVVPPKGQEG